MNTAIAESVIEGWFEKMKRKQTKQLYIAGCLLAAFVLWTILVCRIDVRQIGPNGSCVGFASLNGFVHSLTGVSMMLYTITDWLGLIPLCIVLGFAVFGLVQWIRRKDIRLVDQSILILGGFYLVVAAVYLFFEVIVINARPILINGVLETSYPSSTTMLALCVMPTAILQFRQRIQSLKLRQCVCGGAGVFTVFMTVGRLLSGVHWFTDIIGGILVSCGLVLLYDAAVQSGSNR